MIKVIIIEDEKSGQDLIKSYLNSFFPECEIVAITDNVIESIDAIKSLQPNLVFVDVQIKGGYGIDVLKAFEVKDFHSIFITAYDKYAIEAINQEAIGYLLKPIVALEFQEAVGKIISKIKSELNICSHLQIPIKNGIKIIDTSQIMYLKAEGSYTYIMLGEERFISTKNIGEYEDLLKSSSFYRIHHSYLLNINFIDTIHKERGGEVILKNGSSVPISHRKLASFMQHLKSLN